MSDVTYPVTPNFVRVHQWNTDALIYKHGSLMQQALKLYRHLGDISEGVQKMNNLAVAKGLGNYMVSLVGLAAFAKIEPVVLGEMYDLEGGRAYKSSQAAIVTGLVKETVQLVKALEHLSTVPDDADSRGFARYRAGELFACVKQLASRSAVVLDRTVVNATDCLCKKTGKMNEFGLFEPTGTEEPSRLERAFATMATSMAMPSAAIMAVRIRTVIRHTLTGQLLKYRESPIPRTERCRLITEAINESLDTLLKERVASDSKYADLLTNRSPAITAVEYVDQTSLVFNDDLVWILKQLEGEMNVPVS